jgi:hypothetical protein
MPDTAIRVFLNRFFWYRIRLRRSWRDGRLLMRAARDTVRHDGPEVR